MQKQTLKTVIFDMDGVIVDTEPVHSYAYKKHFIELGLNISEQEYFSYLGKSTKNVYQLIKNKYNLNDSVENLVNQKRQIFNNAFDFKKDLYLIEGVENIIKYFHENKIQLILASSAGKTTINKVFERFDLFKYFSHIVSGEDFPNSKPNPDIFLEAFNLSKNQKNECIIIEDSYNGIKAANSAGIFCVAYNSINSEMQDLTLANFVINEFSELNINLINTLLNNKV